MPQIRKFGGGKDFIQTAFRMPPAMHEALRNAADESGRSLNAEMVHRIGNSLGMEFPSASKDDANDVIGLLEEISEHLSAIRAQTASHVKQVLDPTIFSTSTSGAA